MSELSAIAAWLSDDLGYPWDFTSDQPPPRELQIAIARHQWEDPQERYTNQGEFDHDIGMWFEYLANEAGWTDAP